MLMREYAANSANPTPAMYTCTSNAALERGKRENVGTENRIETGVTLLFNLRKLPPYLGMQILLGTSYFSKN